MSAALGLLLIAQLNSFEFTEISVQQYAGDSFALTVVAKDPYGGIYPFNGSALLSTTEDDLWTYVYPNVITFLNGVWQGDVMVTLAESLRLRCVEPQNLVTGESNTIAVFPGPPEKFAVILPGEEVAPGSPDGKLPNPPETQVAGSSFEFDVYLTDAWHNMVGFREDSVYFGATDNFATLPQGGALSNGSGTFNASMRQAGTQRIHVGPGVGSPVRPDTSTGFTVVPGTFEHLLVLLPGEAHLPGDNTTQVWQTPGKSGEPLTQYVQIPFSATIYACDGCWNRTTGPGDSITLHSDFPFGHTPERAELADSTSFSVRFNSAGPNQNIWTSNLSGSLISYRTQLEIKALGVMLEVSAPDTVRAGETAYVHVTLKDANREPIVAAPCRFAVIVGSGDMLDAALLTDTLGRVTARFLCTRAYGNEPDTIRINADTTVDIEIFVLMSDSTLLKGNVIAFPNPFGFNQDRVEINYYLQRSAPTTVTVHDPFGNEVITWTFAPGMEGALSGLNRIHWNGRNTRRRRVANGIYIVQIIGQLHTGTTFKGTCRIGVVW